MRYYYISFSETSEGNQLTHSVKETERYTFFLGISIQCAQQTGKAFHMFILGMRVEFHDHEKLMYYSLATFINITLKSVFLNYHENSFLKCLSLFIISERICYKIRKYNLLWNASLDSVAIQSLTSVWCHAFTCFHQSKQQQRVVGFCILRKTSKIH